MSVTTMPISESVVHVYPRLISLHDLNPQSADIPSMLRCSKDKFIDDGAYLLGKN
jgi:protein transport protein SEC24